MNKVFEFIIRINLLVSVAVGAMVYQTQVIFKCQDFIVVAFSFFSTLLIYNFQRIYKNRSRNRNTSLSEWMVKNKTSLNLVTILSGISCLYLGFYLHPKSILLLSIPFAISIFYVVRIIRIKNKSLALREIPYLKIFFITLIWTVVVVLFPILNYFKDLSIFNAEVGIYFLEKFFFVFAVTIPFDIRDLKYDPPEMRTLAQALGKELAVKISFILIFIAMAFCFIQFKFLLIDQLTMATLLISYFIFGLLISTAQNEKGDWFYGGLLESFFIMQSVLVIFIQS